MWKTILEPAGGSAEDNVQCFLAAAAVTVWGEKCHSSASCGVLLSS